MTGKGADRLTCSDDIRGATRLIDILHHYPGGEAAALMTRLTWACACCGGVLSEPLALAAKRHGNPPGAVVHCFRALDHGGPTAEQMDAARAKIQTRQPLDLTARYAGIRR
jgi:hypothetical protein